MMEIYAVLQRENVSMYVVRNEVRPESGILVSILQY